MIQAMNVSTGDPQGRIVKVTCPRCRHAGTFDALGVSDLVVNTGSPLGTPGILRLGHRACPDPKCRAHLFFVWADNPPLLIDFDTSDIPPRIVEVVEEAIKCHGNACYKAAAMMVRKALEVLCEERGATGKDLKARVVALAVSIIIPKDLVAGLDNLRLLGNDAAHLEAKTYDDIGSDEVETAIELTKEVLKACYQYSGLVKRLKPKTP